MEKLSYRKLQRMTWGELSKRLPCEVTVRRELAMVLNMPKQYKGGDVGVRYMLAEVKKKEEGL